MVGLFLEPPFYGLNCFVFPYSQHGFISVYYARGKAAATPQLFAGFLVVPMGCVVAALDLHLRCAQAKWEVLQLIWRLWKWILGCLVI